MTLSKIGPIWTDDHLFFPKLQYGIRRKGHAVKTTADAQFQIRQLAGTPRFLVYRAGQTIELRERFDSLDEAKAFVEDIYRKEREIDR